MSDTNEPRDWLVFAARYSRGREGDAGAVWWRPEAAGYTRDLSEAGRFTEADARTYADRTDGEHVAVPLAVAERAARRTVDLERLATAMPSLLDTLRRRPDR